LVTDLTDFKTGKIGLGQFSKAVGAALRNLLFNRSKGFEVAGDTFNRREKCTI
jgi:hypothetical protein